MRQVRDIETPALLVDVTTLDDNIHAADRLLAGSDKRIRPHVKTHRTPAIALLQQTSTATGVTCATVGEAEAMIAAGLDDVLVANEIASATKLGRLADLAGRARVAVAVDAVEPLAALSQEAVRRGVTVDVLVDIDVGLHRCGVQTLEDARDLACLVERSAGVTFAGLMGYEGRVRFSATDRPELVARAFASLSEAKSLIEKAGLDVRVISGGGTSTLLEALQDPVVTEIQAGTYALMEDDIDDLGLPFRCAASVLASVISRSGTRTVVDVGRKTAGCEYGLPRPEATAKACAVSEEHTVLEWSEDPPAIGEKILLVPSNIRTTFNLHDTAWLVRGDEIVERLEVTARGRSQ